MDQAAAVVARFNDCITGQDLEGLGRLMSPDHRFTDTAGTTLQGQRASLEAWSRFFITFPGYQNVFSIVSARGNEVAMAGASVCPGHPELEGPAVWAARIEGTTIAEWRVYEDAPEIRERLGLPRA
jgi:ketosteroid isomerase-like protein